MKKRTLKKRIDELEAAARRRRKPRRRAPPPGGVLPAAAAEGGRRPDFALGAALTRSQRDRIRELSSRMFSSSQPMPGVVPDGVFETMKSSIKRSCDHAAYALDSAVTAFGGWGQGGEYGAFAEGQEFLGYPYLSMLAQRPEYRMVSEIPAGDMTRKWLRVKSKSTDGGDAEKIKQLTEELERLKVREMFGKSSEYDGYMGRHHLFLDVGDDEDELRNPIGSGRDDVTKLKVERGSFKGIRSIEAIWVYPTMYNSLDPLSENWYSPDTWYVMGKEVHRSRLLTFVGHEVPDILKPAYAFGGLSMSQMAKPYVDNWLRTRQSVSDLIHSFIVWALGTDLATMLQPGKEAELMKRVEMFNNMRDNKGMVLFDKNTEALTNLAAPLGTLDALQAQSQEQMCSVSRIPLVKFTGITPHGLNASSDGEIRTYYDTINANQPKFFGPNFDIVFALAQHNLWGGVDADLTYEWITLYEMGEKERAEVRKIEADTDAVLVDVGALDAHEVRQRVASDPDSPHAGLDVDKEVESPIDEGEGDPEVRRDAKIGQGGGVGDDPRFNEAA